MKLDLDSLYQAISNGHCYFCENHNLPHKFKEEQSGFTFCTTCEANYSISSDRDKINIWFSTHISDNYLGILFCSKTENKFFVEKSNSERTMTDISFEFQNHIDMKEKIKKAIDLVLLLG